jgi:hypothetical protein
MTAKQLFIHREATRTCAAPGLRAAFQPFCQDTQAPRESTIPERPPIPAYRLQFENRDIFPQAALFDFIDCSFYGVCHFRF